MFDSYAALSWIVEDGKDACLIPAFDTAAMAYHAISLIESSDKLKCMQQAALENARRFNIDQVGKIWLDFFVEKAEM